MGYFIVFIGIAQFAVAQAPAISGIAPSSGPVGTPVTLSGTNLGSPTIVTIGSKAAVVISNNGTQLVAMVMPGAVTGVASVTTAGGTANSPTNFTVTASLVPNAQQGSKLVGTGYSGTPSQGFYVTLSADGNTAAVGGNGDGSGIGATWIYTRSGGGWTQQARLVGTGSIGNANQGTSVTLSADGNTVLIGGAADNSNIGAAWVFTRNGGTWTQEAKLVGSGSIGTTVLQGTSVSLSADGNTAIVGGYGDNSFAGATWVFTRSGSTWSQQGSKLVGTGATAGIVDQGISVSSSADGNTIIIGGNRDNGNIGAAWIFTRSGSTWSQQGSKLVGTGVGGTSSYQGYAVSISSDGNTALVGGFTDNVNQGATWVFTRSGSTWSQQGSKLVGTGNSGAAKQGAAVSLSADGNTALVGGFTDNTNQGAAWVFTRSGSTWSQQGSKLVGTGNVGAARQGYSVFISADGNSTIVGGISDNSSVGAAWVFVNNALLPLTLLSFTGKQDGKLNQLKWTTADETNTQQFIIERSTDGSSFSSIATVNARGTGNGVYDYSDAFISFVTVYYRLKVMDKNGGFTYSGIIKFYPHPVNTLSLYPNPVISKSTLLFSSNSLLGTVARIMDSKGRPVIAFTLSGNFQMLDLSTLSPGLYLLQTIDGSTLKIIKE